MPGLRIKLDLTDFIHNVSSKRVMYIDLETVRTIADLETKIRDEHSECSEHQILMFLEGGFLLTTWEPIQVLNNEDLIKVVLQPLLAAGESSAQKIGKKRKRAKTPATDTDTSQIAPTSNKKAKILPKIFGSHKDRLNHSQDRIKKRKESDFNGETSGNGARIASTSSEKKKAQNARQSTKVSKSSSSSGEEVNTKKDKKAAIKKQESSSSSDSSSEDESNKASTKKKETSSSSAAIKKQESSSSSDSSSEDESNKASTKKKETSSSSAAIKKQESSSSSDSSSEDESNKASTKKKETSSSSESSSEDEKKGNINKPIVTNKVVGKKEDCSSDSSESEDDCDDGKTLVNSNKDVKKPTNKAKSSSSDSSSSSEEEEVKASNKISNINKEEKVLTKYKDDVVKSNEMNGDAQQKSANNGFQTEGKKKRKRKRKNKNKNKLPPGVSWTDFYNQDVSMDCTNDQNATKNLNSTPITSAFKGTPSSNTKVVFDSQDSQDSSSESEEEKSAATTAHNEAACDFSAEEIRKLYAMSQPANSATPSRGEVNKEVLAQSDVNSPSSTSSRQSVSRLMAFQPRVLTLQELKKNSVNGIKGNKTNKSEVNDGQTDVTNGDINTSVIQDVSVSLPNDDQNCSEQRTEFKPINTSKDTYTNNSFVIENAPDYTKLAAADVATIKVDDVIAFKRIEMSENYTPELSDYKHGKIVHRDDTLLTVQILSSVKKKKAGRFELNPEEDIEEDSVIQLHIADLIDAKIMQ